MTFSTAPAAPEPDPRPLRVVVVDDQALVRSGFAMILGVETDLEVVGEARDGAAAVEVVTRLRPDVVLMDVEMPGMDGIEATRIIVEGDLAKVVILTTFDRDDYLVEALRAGASGFLLKNAEPEKLVDAVRVVGRGHALLAPEVTRRVIERMTAGPTRHTPTRTSRSDQSPSADSADSADPADSADSADPADSADSVDSAEHDRRDAPLAVLTHREREVLVLIGRGLSNQEIAGDLYVGEATVKTHVSNVLAKLHLRDRVQAVVLAHECGLIPRGDHDSPTAG